MPETLETKLRVLQTEVRDQMRNLVDWEGNKAETQLIFKYNPNRDDWDSEFCDLVEGYHAQLSGGNTFQECLEGTWAALEECLGRNYTTGD